jgi:NAD(P)-dependent dehydrogenase (short-subunit alcohol dehydrogenase family)
MQDIFSLQKKVALITGGGSGIGYAIASCMLNAGAKVVIVGRREEPLKQAVATLGTNAHYFVGDVTVLEQLPQLVNQIESTVGPIDILVNNAGINMKKPAVEVSDDDFSKVIDTNLNAVFALSRICGAAMVQRQQGAIIMISSMAAYYGLDRVVAYSASKHGVEGLVKVLSAEWAKHGVRVNAIAPGFIETDMVKTAMNADQDRFQKAMSRTQIGRFGTPAEIGKVAVFLASNAASYVTGVSLPVDGGNSIGF